MAVVTVTAIRMTTMMSRMMIQTTNRVMNQEMSLAMNQVTTLMSLASLGSLAHRLLLWVRLMICSINLNSRPAR